MNDRVILHCDMNAFYASVELLERPDLDGLPVAVCGAPESRHGIILAKNQMAKEAGVKTAMILSEARRLCPGLVCIPPHMEKYRHYSKVINEIYGRFTDMIEPFSVDESWLDVTASQRLFGDGKTIADTIRRTVFEETGLTLSAGVSFNKIFAKMGSEYKKPDATTVISRENYRDLLWPLDVGELFFVGRATAGKLRELGIQTIGDLAAYDKDILLRTFGKQGTALWESANGLDDAPVALSYEKRRIKSVGNGMTFRRNIRGEDDVRTALIALSDTVASRLRSYGLKALGVKVDIRDPDFKTISRQTQIPRPTDDAEELARYSLELIRENNYLSKPIRLITVTAINLTEEEDVQEQLSLFSAGSSAPDQKKIRDLHEAMDSIRDKYGRSSLSYASVLDNDIGFTVTSHTNDEEGLL